MLDSVSNYLRQDGRYDTDEMWSARRLLTPTEPKRFELGDVVFVRIDHEWQAKITASTLGDEVRAVVVQIFLTVRDWRKESSNWNYRIRFENGYISYIDNFTEIRKTGEHDTAQLLSDTTQAQLDSVITPEVYDAAEAHNTRIEQQIQAIELDDLQKILAKADADISDAEWQHLVSAGFAETYFDNSAPEDFASWQLYRRRAVPRPDAPLFADETEEQLASRGL